MGRSQSKPPRVPSRFWVCEQVKVSSVCDSSSSWATDWAAMFAERGYTAVEVDIEAGGSSSATAAERIKGMVSGKFRAREWAGPHTRPATQASVMLRV